MPVSCATLIRWACTLIALFLALIVALSIRDYDTLLWVTLAADPFSTTSRSNASVQLLHAKLQAARAEAAQLAVKYSELQTEDTANNAATPMSEVLSLRAQLSAGQNSSGSAAAAAFIDDEITDTRFLILVDASEGIAGWINCLREASTAARALNRTLVEPCVQDGHLTACVYGRVVSVPDGHDAADVSLASSGVDLLAIQRSADSCQGPATRHMLRKNSLLPLRAYFDWHDLLTNWVLSPMIRYHDWEALRVAPAGTSAASARAAGKLWVREDGIIVAGTHIAFANNEPCNPAPGIPFRYMSFYFEGRSCSNTSLKNGGLNSNVVEFLSEPQFAAARDAFLGHWARTPRNSLELVNENRMPKFNPLHYIAVRRWVATAVRQGSPDQRYAVVQWRSAHVKADSMSYCSSAIINTTASMFPGPLINPLAGTPVSTFRPTRFVLVADVPSPSNICGIWDHGDLAGRPIVDDFFNAGFMKYDEAHFTLDGGILSIRDMILGMEAEWYLTCSFQRIPDGPPPNELLCSRCYWHSSYIVQVVRARIAANKLSNVGFGANASTLRPPPPPI